MAAHNEEKLIDKSLGALVNLDYKDYEVLVGLDGCTDGTEKIVDSLIKSDKRIKKHILNFRKGKTEVVNYLIEKAKGDIIIINDADWIFKPGRDGLKDIAAIFKDKSIGGIADSYPVSCNQRVLNIIRGRVKNKEYSMPYLASAWFNYQLMRFNIRQNTLETQDGREIKKEGTPYYHFLTNIFRRELFKKNETLGDDIERTNDILASGKRIVMITDSKFPRMIAAYKAMNYPDIYKQKKRTTFARKQVGLKYIHLNKESSPKGRVENFIISQVLKIKNIALLASVLVYISILVIATLHGQAINTTTQKGWRLRAKR